MNFRKILLLATTGLALILAPSAQATMLNAVPNPGFEETGCTYGAIALPDICAWNPGYGSMISRDTRKPHSGSASMALVGFSGKAEALSDPAFCTPIGPGRHAASYWYRTPDAGSPDTNVAFALVGLNVSWWKGLKCTGSGSSSELSAYAAILDNQWHEVAGDVVAPQGTASVSFGFAIRSGCDLCRVGAEFDDVAVEVEPLPDTTASTDGGSHPVAAAFHG
jgi:hypothetical protein